MILLLLFTSLLITTKAHALQIPEKPQSYVNDYAKLLSNGARGQIENTLADFEKATSTQVVVAIFPSREGESLEDFSIHLAEKWKIGSKKNSNGIILLIFRDDHKVRIEVGYGLEGALPDLVASQIIRNQITPAFRAGNYDKGVSDAVQAIIQSTKGEYKAANESVNDPIQKHSGLLFVLLMLYLILPIVCYAGVVGASVVIFGFPIGLVIGLISVFFLVLLRQLFVATSAGTTLTSRGSRYWGGGGFLSGGLGGGGFSSGGFGGGGGGSFGGGGASGGW
ncbi:MAG: hypothetical protein AUJ72_06105 [Candidatus Omnitrophica bacterium CG1_02_46_14]|nr:MAG: hypothetical protein AUJ72_06105 [Candidatus Omnitrophica bacterium CG1_02_46_14]